MSFAKLTDIEGMLSKGLAIGGSLILYIMIEYRIWDV
jgi:hypothetical protein